jgi:MarR family transcriptional regulator, temperature-dependent positive regulator of motility
MIAAVAITANDARADVVRKTASRGFPARFDRPILFHMEPIQIDGHGFHCQVPNGTTLESSFVSRREKARYDFAPDTVPADATAGFDELTRIRLWSNPCWLSARLNILANRFNVPMYGWIDERFGLSRPEFVVLFSLNLCPAASASAISTSTGFPKNTLSRAINRLLKLKLVSRHDDPADKRSFRLLLTAKGKAIVDEAIPRLYTQERVMMDCLDKSERATLATLMAKMVVALERKAGQADGLD